MTETMIQPTRTLSPNTQAAVQGLTRARSEVEKWTANLEQALADDVAATPPRLTPSEAAAVARANGVNAPPRPGSTAEATETTPEMNQAQLDARTTAAEAEAAKDAKIAATAQPKDEAEVEARKRAEHERGAEAKEERAEAKEEREAQEKAKAEAARRR